jgi:hypothetical protein
VCRRPDGGRTRSSLRKDSLVVFPQSTRGSRKTYASTAPISREAPAVSARPGPNERAASHRGYPCPLSHAHTRVECSVGFCATSPVFEEAGGVVFWGGRPPDGRIPLWQWRSTSRFPIMFHRRRLPHSNGSGRHKPTLAAAGPSSFALTFPARVAPPCTNRRGRASMTPRLTARSIRFASSSPRSFGLAPGRTGR